MNGSSNIAKNYAVRPDLCRRVNGTHTLNPFNIRSAELRAADRRNNLIGIKAFANENL